MVDARRPASSARWRRPRSVSRSGPRRCSGRQLRPLASTAHASALYYMHHGVSSGSRRRVRATPGPSCCGCWPATPRSRSCTSRPTRNVGRGGRRAVPGPARRLRATCGTRRSTAADLAGLDLVFCLLPHGASQALLPGLLDHVGHVDRSRRRLPPARRRVRPLEQRSAPRARGRSTGSRTASSSCTATRSPTHAHVASPGCHATAISLACAPLLALDLVEPRIIADSVSGVSGAGRGLKTTSLFSEANENVSAYGLLTHFHTAEMEQTLTKVARQPVSVLFTPHLVPTTRGILATCYARPATTGLSTARLLEHYREFYADDPCVFVVDEPSGTKATYGANVAHVTVRFDARTETVVAIAAEDNLVKGASGQMIQAANLLLGLPETTGLPLARDPAVSRLTAAKGFVAGGLACGIKESGDARPRAGRHRRSRGRFPRRRCSRATSRRPRRCRSRARTSPTGGRPRSCSAPATPTRRPASPAGATRARMCELAADGPRRRDRPTCSCARPASSGSRCRWTRSRPASRSCAARSRPTAAPTRRRRS